MNNNSLIIFFCTHHRSPLRAPFRLTTTGSIHCLFTLNFLNYQSPSAPLPHCKKQKIPKMTQSTKSAKRFEKARVVGLFSRTAAPVGSSGSSSILRRIRRRTAGRCWECSGCRWEGPEGQWGRRGRRKMRFCWFWCQSKKIYVADAIRFTVDALHGAHTIPAPCRLVSPILIFDIILPLKSIFSGHGSTRDRLERVRAPYFTVLRPFKWHFKLLYLPFQARLYFVSILTRLPSAIRPQRAFLSFKSWFYLCSLPNGRHHSQCEKNFFFPFFIFFVSSK